MTPTSSIQPVIEEIVREEESKKVDVVSTSAAATPPVQEIRYQPNPYVNAPNPSVTPTLSVMGYAPPQPSFTAPMESAGTIYHTGVRFLFHLLITQKKNVSVIKTMKSERIFKFSFVLCIFPFS